MFDNSRQAQSKSHRHERAYRHCEGPNDIKLRFRRRQEAITCKTCPTIDFWPKIFAEIEAVSAIKMIDLMNQYQL
ncbi:hypothetical protein [Rhizobium bangladeshense]|uniref:hypothetical protein n=1 Tax=Rhizobium bangladeshense TaxID=1138189 RepID=UPI001C914AE2|nr:hypothetical protein [Rhizobium bangladeshense]MBY3594524.1 hypothetical protein [Rhizobium bangladeshense]